MVETVQTLTTRLRLGTLCCNPYKYELTAPQKVVRMSETQGWLYSDSSVQLHIDSTHSSTCDSSMPPQPSRPLASQCVKRLGEKDSKMFDEVLVRRSS